MIIQGSIAFSQEQSRNSNIIQIHHTGVVP